MKMNNFNILRIVTQGEMANFQDDRSDQCKNIIVETCKKIKDKVSVIQTAGGFFYDFDKIKDYKPWPNSIFSQFNSIVEKVSITLNQILTSKVKKLLKEKTDFLTIGVDVYDKENEIYNTHSELVGTYDTQKEIFLYWTGKSYPTEQQKDDLIFCPKLETHFQELNGLSVLVLGCHDLNMFSPRSRASIGSNGKKSEIIKHMQELCNEYKPQVVLQHPHTTDTPNIWAQGWIGVRRFLTEVKLYSSGINYFNPNGKPRKSLSNVLEKTAIGDVQNVIFSCSEDGAIDGF